MGSPCPGYPVATPYGEPGSWAAGYHTGADYACPAGTDIVAAAAGHVVQNIYDESYGWMVELESDGVRHRYCHLRAQSWAAPGAWLAEGAHLGEAGSTGNSTGPHLHYEERAAPFGYWDHRPPVFNTQGVGTTPPPPQHQPLEDDDMFIIYGPNRGHSLLGPGYEKGLTEEELHVLIDCGIRVVEHNDRGFDVARAACLHGDATD